jgi:acyl transferase domain-containing protein
LKKSPAGTFPGITRILPGKRRVYGSFLENIDQFDSLFFNVSGVEATYMDPQQRLFLEESWRALEDAGYAGTSMGGRLCGVYVGCGTGDYHQLFPDNPPAQAIWANAISVIPPGSNFLLFEPARTSSSR